MSPRDKVRWRVDKHLENLWAHVLPTQDISMEIGLFRLITLTASVLCIFIILPIDIALDLPFSLNLIVSLYGLVTFYLHFSSRQGRHFIKAFFAVTLLVLNAAWFLRAGSDGSISYYFFAVVLYPLIFFRGFLRAATLLLLLLNDCTLQIVEHAYPFLVTPFKSTHDRMLDQVSGFAFSATTCALVFWVVVSTLEREIEERRGAEASLKTLNNGLDLRVRERTSLLEATLREQESFSYTVSHDLRAPLRHINSYLSILSEDFEATLPPKARVLLDRACTATRRMGNMIDDILELARVSRTQLDKKTVNLSDLATLTFTALKETDPARPMEPVISDGLVTQGDKQLLTLLMANLLENAWKYSSNNPAAKIEFGKVVDAVNAGQEIFYVRDNGVGFDMAYSDKLFGEFQRLHGSEFEGNGIGLATVKRIVDRHSGRIWAESKPGEGATFYFTL
jgi:signal transduction histidine kinase